MRPGTRPWTDTGQACYSVLAAQALSHRNFGTVQQKIYTTIFFFEKSNSMHENNLKHVFFSIVRARLLCTIHRTLTNSYAVADRFHPIFVFGMLQREVDGAEPEPAGRRAAAAGEQRHHHGLLRRQRAAQHQQRRCRHEPSRRRRCHHGRGPLVSPPLSAAAATAVWLVD